MTSWTDPPARVLYNCPANGIDPVLLLLQESDHTGTQIDSTASEAQLCWAFFLDLCVWTS